MRSFQPRPSGRRVPPNATIPRTLARSLCLSLLPFALVFVVANPALVAGIALGAVARPVGRRLWSRVRGGTASRRLPLRERLSQAFART